MKAKRQITMIAAAVMTAAMSMTAFAGGWQQDNTGWRYGTNEANTEWYANGWQWIDGNGDGTAECYYFDSNGYILSGTTTPDGYQVNTDGAWVKDGTVQTQTTADTATAQTDDSVVSTDDGVWINGVHHNAGYDPEHPLKNVPESWDLKLDDAKASNRITRNGVEYIYGYNYICRLNVQAMLTGQMEYYQAYTGYEAEEYKAQDQALYEWFCNWLNSFDFENMSEYDKACKIRDELYKAKCYADPSDWDSYTKTNEIYKILIEKAGVCQDFAMTTLTLAHSMGLKAFVTYQNDHAWAYLLIDGEPRRQDNQEIYVDMPLVDDNYNVDVSFITDYLTYCGGPSGGNSEEGLKWSSQLGVTLTN